MSLSYSPVAVRGVVVEPVYAKLLFLNNTVGKGLVNFQENVKADTIVSEAAFTTTMQAYASGAPTASGTIAVTDKAVTPTKVMFYDEFDPETLRTSRFKRSMADGAWNLDSQEFTNLIMNNYAPKVSLTMEGAYWNGATSATQTAVAALTSGTGQTSVGAAEKTLVAAMPTNQFDSIVAVMIYNNAAVGGRVKVAGTTVSSSNIATEYGKVYAAIPAEVLVQPDQKPYIYAPYSHKQLINIFNVSATYRDLFSVDIAADKYFYNGIEIQFVPLAENTIVCALPENLLWCTDLLSDLNELKIDKIANNREDMFIKAIMTLGAHVIRQSVNVLYVG